jgi:serine/threonine protein kinase
MTEPESSSKPPVAQPKAGDLLDSRFLIQRKLGSGNFGAVYLAEQRIFGMPLRSVALKLFHTAHVTPENAMEVFNDAIMLVCLQQESTYAEVSNHLIGVYDAGFLHERPEQAFIAMEYVDGYHLANGKVIPTLEKMIQTYQPVPVELAIRWMIQILEPLAWMHTLPRPVFHCDLKPDNILCSGKDNLKVADFGLANLAFQIFGGSNNAGAISYQAPETLTGNYPSAASDVYSLGLTFHEILSGKNPLYEVGMAEMADNKMDKYTQVQIMARYNGIPELTEQDNLEMKDHPLLAGIIQQCLRYKASDRYGNAKLLLDDLRKYQEPGPGPVPPPPPQPSHPATMVSLERLLSEAVYQLNNGKIEDARKRFEQARLAYPGSAKPIWGLARVLLTNREWQAALKLCVDGRAIDSNDPEGYDVMADAYEVGGQPGMVAQMQKLALSARQRSGR